MTEWSIFVALRMIMLWCRCTAAIYPATLARSLKVLEFTSVGAILSILFAFGVVFARYVQGPTVAPVVIVLDIPFPQLFMALPIQACAYCNQFVRDDMWHLISHNPPKLNW
eukprot:SAG11_NODE_14193_length_622_cov_0.755258_1_plen_110_part_10